MNGPCGIHKHAYLFSLMASHPDEFECDDGNHIDCELNLRRGTKLVTVDM